MAQLSSVDSSAMQKVQRLVLSGDYAGAISLCDKLVEVNPDDVVLLLFRARLADQAQHTADAELFFRRAATTSTLSPLGHRHLAAWLQSQGRTNDVLAAVADGLKLFPEDLPLLSIGFRAGANDDNIALAIQVLEELILTEDDAQVLSDTLNLLSPLFQSFGESAFVERLIGRLVEIEPASIDNRRCQAFTSLYNDALDPLDLAKLHFEFGQMVETSIAPKWPQFSNNRNADRKLRIGYLSPDFKAHVVANFNLGWIEMHDPDEVEVTLYIGNSPDSVTERFIAASEKHRFIRDLSPVAVAEKIKSDKIDILVDFAGHTTGSLTAMLALRPAPVQVSYVGYAATTGLSRINYRIVDGITDPEGAEELASERLYRLDRCFLGYERITELPALSSVLPDVPTAGTFNNLIKVSDSTLRAWAKIHQLQPEVRLITKCHLPTSEPLRLFKLAKMREVLERAGGDPDRFDLLPFILSYEESQLAYGQLDIALDPFPYNGTTTTFEALSMGVPVVTLLGTDHRSRVSASILKHVGLDQWIATTVEEYAEIAVDLLNARKENLANRPALRDLLLRSDPCNLSAHVTAIEDAYRTMWRAWCENPV